MPFSLSQFRQIVLMFLLLTGVTAFVMNMGPPLYQNDEQALLVFQSLMKNLCSIDVRHFWVVGKIRPLQMNLINILHIAPSNNDIWEILLQVDQNRFIAIALGNLKEGRIS